MHHASGGFHVAGEGFQVEIQIRQSVVLDVAGNIAQRLKFRQIPHRAGAAGHELRPGIGQRLLQAGIDDGRAGVLLEFRAGGDVHQ